jgi:hypothetical protein
MSCGLATGLELVLLDTLLETIMGQVPIVVAKSLAEVAGYIGKHSLQGPGWSWRGQSSGLSGPGTLFSLMVSASSVM